MLQKIISKIKRKVVNIGTGGEWTTIIKPRTGWFDINLLEVWRYRDVIKLYVYRDFVATYKQTVLGPLWWLIQPLFSSGIYTMVFSVIAGIQTDGIPPILFYIAGTVCWNYFADCLTATSDTFVVNAPVFSKVYFPRLTAPIATVIINLFKFCVQFCLFLIVYVVYWLYGANLSPNWWILLLPVLLGYIAALSMGLGIIASSLTTKYKDLKFMLTYLIQLAMYATPIVYPLSLVPEKIRPLALLNPMTIAVESFRFMFFGEGSLNPQMFVWSICCTLVLLFLGVVFFSRVEKNFADTI